MTTSTASEMTRSLKITDLPSEVLLRIFVKLNIRDLFTDIASVCKTFHDLLFSEGIWKTLIGLKYTNLQDFRLQDDSMYISSWKNVVCSYDDALTLKSFAYKQERIKTIKLCRHFAPVDTVHVMPGCKLCLSGARDRTITVWDIQTHEAVHDLNPHKGWIWAVKSNERCDNQFASASWDTMVKLWDLNRPGTEEDMLMGCFKNHPAAVLSMSFNNNMIITGCFDKKIRMLDPRTGDIEREIKQHKRSVLSLLEINDHMLLSGSEDKTIGVYDTRACKTICNISVGTQVLALNSGLVQGFNYLRVGGFHGMLLIYSMEGSRFLLLNSYELWNKASKVTSLASYHGSLVAGSEDGTVRFYSPGRQTKLLLSAAMHKSTVTDIHVRGDSMATASNDVGLTTTVPSDLNPA